MTGSLLMLLLACAAHGGAAGRAEAQRVQLDLAGAMVEGGAPDAALGLIATLREQGASGPEVDLLQARAQREAGLLDAAEAQVDALLERHPRDPEAWSERGQLDMARRDPGAASEAFRRAAELDGSRSEHWNNLGFSLLAAGRPQEARDALRIAQGLDSQSLKIRNNLGLAEVALGRVPEAEALLAASYPPAEVSYRLGVALELYASPAEAAARYTEALTRDPGHAAARRALDRLGGAATRAPTAGGERGSP